MSAPPPYIWPFATKSAKQYKQVDQGWDLQDTTVGDVYAIAAGTVAYFHDSAGFGKDYAVVTLDTPDANGPAIYYGHCVPIAEEGSHVNQGSTVSTTIRGPQGNASQPGWLEIGWWSGGPTGNGQAMHDTLINAPTKSGANIGGGTSDGSGGGGNDSGKGSKKQDTTNQHWIDVSAQTGPQIANLKDPDSNLPFSAYFMGQQFNGSGTFKPQLAGRSPIISTGLVRGGMAELSAKRFKCYFMMNPMEISGAVGISDENLSPLQQSADLFLSGGYWASNQTIGFKLIFNRMYEVWQGNIPGPSDIGCRWDIRALERLLGIFDAVSDNGLSVGLGNYGWGQSAGMGLPLQVVFGGPNSMQFQGTISKLEYTFTIFDSNMIPVEATADVEVMRVYQPQQSTAPLVQSIITQSGLIGPQSMTPPVGTGIPGAGPVGPGVPFTK